MIAARPDIPLPPVTESEADYYRQGDSIDLWLRRVSRDVSLQQKKTAILTQLAEMPCDPQMLTDIGDHNSTSLEVLFVLAESGNVDLKYALAENHNIHRNVLNRLCEDSNPYVAFRARKTLSRIEGGANRHPEQR